MATRPKTRQILRGIALVCVVLWGPAALAHGGVVEEADVCVIKINYFKGHFKIYQPRTDGQEEYCEDLPAATESVFVMEYLHDGMAEVPIDFRIIHDVTGKGRFARWVDVEAIDDLDAVTVYYREPVIEPDVYTAVYEFAAEGDYIGIVTAAVGDKGETYRAVFPFEVGFTGFGYWPLIIAVLVFIQLQYLLMSGRLRRWWHSLRAGAPAAVILVLALATSPPADAGENVSARALFRVSYSSALQPIEINRMHSWELTVRDADGNAVNDAEISLTGGMPAHNHGLPTRPRVTADAGDGRYRVDGLRFHMAGHWELTLTITAGGRTDTVVIPLDL